MSETRATKAHAVGINHVALEVGDIGEALAFYGRFLAFAVEEQTTEMAIVYFGDQFINFIRNPDRRPDAMRHFGIVVDDKPLVRSTLEAMGVGVPVVQPRRGAFTEMVEKTGGGVLVPPDDPQALADALHSLWQDPARLDQLGRRGFDGVREHYSIQRSTDRLLTVYEKLTGDFRL